MKVEKRSTSTGCLTRMRRDEHLCLEPTPLAWISRGLLSVTSDNCVLIVLWIVSALGDSIDSPASAAGRFARLPFPRFPSKPDGGWFH